MAHEEQNDPVAQSSMYQRRPPNLEASTADLSERDIKENLVVKEEETNDTEVFEDIYCLKVAVCVVWILPEARVQTVGSPCLALRNEW